MVLVVAVSCGRTTEQSTASGAGGTAAGGTALATLAIIDSDALVRSGGATEYASASTGRPLAVGDGVRTNATGFAEVTYFDGSLARVDRDGSFDVVELSETSEAKVVRGRLGDGSASWQNVEKLGEKDSFSVDTPVGNASVRGTEFAIDCTQPDICEFAVVEGVVDVKLLDGTVVTVRAGEVLRVKKNEKPPPPENVGVDELKTRPWITKNLSQDEKRRSSPTTTAGTPSPSEATASSGARRTFAASVTLAANSRPDLPTPAGPLPAVGTSWAGGTVILTGGCDGSSPCSFELAPGSGLTVPLGPSGVTKSITAQPSGAGYAGSTVIEWPAAGMCKAYSEKNSVEFSLDGNRVTGTWRQEIIGDPAPCVKLAISLSFVGS